VVYNNYEPIGSLRTPRRIFEPYARQEPRTGLPVPGKKQHSKPANLKNNSTLPSFLGYPRELSDSNHSEIFTLVSPRPFLLVFLVWTRNKLSSICCKYLKTGYFLSMSIKTQTAPRGWYHKSVRSGCFRVISEQLSGFQNRSRRYHFKRSRL
jgi:hypothetical protein